MRPSGCYWVRVEVVRGVGGGGVGGGRERRSRSWSPIENGRRRPSKEDQRGGAPPLGVRCKIMCE